MCLLDGSVSGSLPADHDFANEAPEEEGEVYKLKKIPLVDIITGIVINYGGDRTENLIVADLEQYGYELLDYRGSSPLYFLMEVDGGVLNVTLAGGTTFPLEDDTFAVALKDIEHYYSFNALNPDQVNQNCTIVKYDQNRKAYVARVQNQETAGYHRTELVYNEETLTLSAGTAAIEAIKKVQEMLGSRYEFFYDEYGKFVFQKKKSLQTDWFTLENGELTSPVFSNLSYGYKFDDKKLITNISLTPNLQNVKNDFSIIGTRTNTDGKELAIRGRFAIDKKPTKYVSPLSGITYQASVENPQQVGNVIYCDWRELIYQMAFDYLQKNKPKNGHFLLELEKANPEFVGGKTGYETYYTDVQAFWRQIYNPAKPEGYLETGWHKDCIYNPSNLLFWFDFLDTSGDFDKLSVHKIGDRIRVENSNSVNAVYYNETPEAIVVYSEEEVKTDDDSFSYTPIQVPDNMKDYFFKSVQAVSVLDKANEMLEDTAAAAETINFSAVPLFFLEPNSRIQVAEYGDYSIDRISYSLVYDGTMTVSGNKIYEEVL